MVVEAKIPPLRCERDAKRLQQDFTSEVTYRMSLSLSAVRLTVEVDASLFGHLEVICPTFLHFLHFILFENFFQQLVTTWPFLQQKLYFGFAEAVTSTWEAGCSPFEGG